MQTNQRSAGIVLSYITLIVNALVAFIYVPVLLHFMGHSEYGLYQLMGSLIAYFSILDFGLPSTIIRYYSKYKALGDEKSMENILAMCSRIYVVITGLIVAVGVVLYFYIDFIFGSSLTPVELINAKYIYIVLLINVSITLPSQIFNAIITSYERFVFLKVVALEQAILQPIAVIAVVSMNPSAFSLVIVLTIFNILVVLLRIYYCFAKIHVKIKLHFFDKPLFWSIMKFSSIIFLNVIIDQLFWRSNQLILGVVATTAAVAVYSVAFQIAYNYMTLSTVVSSVFLPKVTEMTTKGVEKKQISNLFTKVGRLQFLLLSCILTGFILFGKQFILLWAGSGFEETYLITLFLIVPFTVDLIQNLGSIILQAENKFAFKVFVFLAIAIINVAVAIPAAQKYGGVGCAAVTGITFFIGNALIMNIYYAKSICLNIKNFWLEIFRIGIFGTLVCLLGSFLNYISLSNKIIELAIKLLAYVTLYLSVMWLFAMNDYEKNLATASFCKLKRKIIKQN